MNVVWEEPPEDARRNGEKSGTYEELAVACRENPGKWARVPGERTEASATTLAQNMRRGKVKGFTPHGYETAVKGSDLWLRYVEPREEEPPLSAAAVRVAEEVSEVTEAAKAFAPAVRAWARDNGREVPSAGRLPDDLVAAYTAATGHRDPRVRVVR